MEGSSCNSPAKKPSSELEALQKKLEEKTSKIQELKSQIESLKLHLDEKKNNNKKGKGVPEEKREAFKNLCEKYDSLRFEYNALLSEKSKE